MSLIPSFKTKLSYIDMLITYLEQVLKGCTIYIITLYSHSYQSKFAATLLLFKETKLLKSYDL